MFGQNPIRSITNDPRNLSVESHFYTIQGEGPFSGQPALFIRLAGCNLACHFCDTQFETKADTLTPLSELFEQLAAYPEHQRKLVVITGGEPMRQNFAMLARWLLLNGTHIIQVETAGTLWQEDLQEYIMQGEVTLVCSPKTPKVHPMIEQHCFHWKYIIIDGQCDYEDGLPNHGTSVATKDKLQRIFRPAPSNGNTIWVSPCDQYEATQNAANTAAVKDIALRHGYTVNIQIHKILGVE
jgi:7-carboxy-7-deazaguanine synthase